MTAQTVTATGVTAQDLGYSFDLASNILGANDNRVPARSQAFTYDALDRLTQGTGLYGQLDYTYDGVGNRLTRVKSAPGGFTETSVIGANDNRLVSVAGGAVSRSFTYTAAGHVTGDGTFGFTINKAGRNVEAKLSGTPVAAYAHNALGQRVKKAIPAGATTLFHYATSGQLLATSDGAGANWTEYVWLGGLPLAQVNAGTIYYAHADHLGAPQALTDGAKAIVWDASFRPFGEVEAQSDSVTNLLRFPGQYFDAETGTHYNYFRDYDPSLGRYLQSDPIGLAGGLNTYSYVDGNPLRYVDPTGEVGLLGAAISGAGDLAFQVFVEGKSLRCVNWSEVLVSAALGAVGGGILSSLGKAGKGSMKARNVARRYRRRNNVPPGHDVHHWAIPRKFRIGRRIPDRIKNDPANLNPIPQGTHRRIHGKVGRGGYGPVKSFVHGSPPWAKTGAGAGATALVAPRGGSCGC